MNAHRPPDAPEPSTGPWWRHPMMWLVVGGPAAVVVAGIVTAVIAVRYPDPVLDTSAAPPSGARTEMPAMQARNHAASPVAPSAGARP